MYKTNVCFQCMFTYFANTLIHILNMSFPFYQYLFEPDLEKLLAYIQSIKAFLS